MHLNVSNNFAVVIRMKQKECKHEYRQIMRLRKVHEDTIIMPKTYFFCTKCLRIEGVRL